MNTRLYFSFEHVPVSLAEQDYPSVEVPASCLRAKIVDTIFQKYPEALKGVDESTSVLTYYNEEENKYAKFEWKYGCGSEERTNIVLKYKKPDPEGTRYSFVVKSIPPGSVDLQEYVETGNRLKRSGSSDMVGIDSGITDFIQAVKECDSSLPCMFAYLDGSSGLGKSQLAFAQDRKVLYLPQGDSQAIYQCFHNLSEVVNQAVALDAHALREADSAHNFSLKADLFSTTYITRAWKDGRFRFRTVELLLKLLEQINTPTPGDSSSAYDTNVFLGVDLSVEIEGVMMSEGRKAAQQYRDVLLHIDEVPMHDRHAPESFLRCLLLRNIIRCMGLPCLLSGTESTLINMIDFSEGSRGSGKQPWVWLLTGFPATKLNNHLEDMMAGCRAYERHMLESTRPLFVQWFSRCHDDQQTGRDEAGQICMTPATLTSIKEKMCAAKQRLPESITTVADATAVSRKKYELPWLHASTLLVFAASLEGSGDVGSTTPKDSSAAQIGMKRPANPRELSASRRKMQKQTDVFHHSLVIRKHFALLYISPSLAIKNYMTALHVDLSKGLCGSDEKNFSVIAAFKSCAEDPLLYLAGLRNGIVRRDDQRHQFVPVPSSYAFSTFRQQTLPGNILAKSNDGTALEAESIAALVLAAHRYDTFEGTPFFTWLALVIAELSFQREFDAATEITQIPSELKAALEGVMVPLLSPPNLPWGDSMGSDINFADFTWCKNLDQRDASAPLSNAKATSSTQEYMEDLEDLEDREVDEGLFLFGKRSHGYTALGAEFKDVNNFGGKNMVAVTTKVAENSVSLLIGRNLSDWKKDTVQKFASDVSVYRMDGRESIERVSEPVTQWKAGRKVLIALNLKKLHPGRAEALPHAT